MTHFFQPGPAPDKAYLNIRDLEHHKATRSYLESLWAWFQPLADAHFLSDARAHFLERFWEMYLAKALSKAGYSPEATRDSGPDFLVKADGVRIWIEATTSGPGQGNDAVPELQFGVAQKVPEEEILLRLRSAISNKLSAWREWRKQGIVKDHDAFVIAINGKRIRPAIGDSEPPYIAKAVFPIGHLIAVFDKNTHGIVDSYYDTRTILTKKSGADVRTDIFLSREYREVSAVIYSFADMVNRPTDEGDEFRLVHNPMASHPIPKGFLARGKEYWIENSELVTKDWSKDA